MRAPEKPKAKLLVIDDEKIVHESVSRILESEGYHMDSALRVDEALKKLAAGTYDLVLTDLMMPDDSGMKAVEAVARDHPHCGVVMFTGFATVESAVESMRLGALDYLPKPFTPDELVEVVETALAKTYKARRDREIAETYSEAEKAIRSSLDLKEILNLICSSVVILLKVKGSALYLFKKASDELDIVASNGLSREYLEKGALTAGKSIPETLNAAEPVFIGQEDFDARLQYPDAARKEGIAGIMSMPVQVDETVLGVLRLYSAEERALSDVEKEILMKFVEQGARALENAMAYERVRGDIEGIKRDMPEYATEQAKK